MNSHTEAFIDALGEDIPNHNRFHNGSGTSRQGYLERTSYKELTELFGTPGASSDDGKCRVEWILEFKDGMIATIYDWQSRGTPLHDNLSWNIGGKEKEVATRINYIVKKRRASNDSK